ncbi:MAG: hypothetical protein HUJ30_01670 [Gammaproteobacteria bacterium]|nr:hypothetical protein [Gammaproteobacteria bacterium]
MLILLFFPLFLHAVEKNIFHLTAEEWSGPRTGMRIVMMPGVQSAIKALDKSPGSTLILKYPGGDVGTIWGEELRSWLLALGVEMEKMELRPGSPAQDIIEMEILHGR